MTVFNLKDWLSDRQCCYLLLVRKRGLSVFNSCFKTKLKRTLSFFLLKYELSLRERFGGKSLSWLECWSVTPEVAGSNPSRWNKSKLRSRCTQDPATTEGRKWERDHPNMMLWRRARGDSILLRKGARIYDLFDSIDQRASAYLPLLGSEAKAEQKI